MAANQQSQESVRFFKLIAKAEKADQANKRVICEIVKKGDAYEVGGWFSSLSGFLTSAEVKEFEFEGKPKKKCVIRLADNDGIYQLEFTFNFATYGLINSMLGTDFTREVEISGWISKKGFVGAGIKYTGKHDSIDWVVPLEESPKGEKYQTPGGEELTDYTKVSQFWLNKFREITPKAVRENFKGTVGAPHDYHTKSTPHSEPIEPPSEADLDDIPF